MSSANLPPPRLRWACRRGMLELDLWLEAFLTDVWVTLTPEHQAVFEKMLEEPDPILYRWLTLQDIPNDAILQDVIHRIRQHARR